MHGGKEKRFACTVQEQGCQMAHFRARLLKSGIFQNRLARNILPGISGISGAKLAYFWKLDTLIQFSFGSNRII